MCAVVLSCVANSVLLQASTTFESLNFPVPFPTVIPEPFPVAEYDIDVLCRAEHSPVPFSLHITCVGLCVTHHLLWKEASLLRLGDALFLAYKDKNLGDSLILYFSSRIILLWPPLMAVPNQPQIFGPVNGIKHEFSIVDWAFNQIKK